jgi:hypothetical protein
LKGLLIVAFGLALAGCVSTSGVAPIGPNLFTIGASAGSVGGSADAQRRAYAGAREYCAANGGGQMEVVNQATDSGIYGQNANVTFRCVTAGVPAP